MRLPVVGARRPAPYAVVSSTENRACVFAPDSLAVIPLGRNLLHRLCDYLYANVRENPFRWTLARPGNRFTHSGRAGQQNVPVDDAKVGGTSAPAAPA